MANTSGTVSSTQLDVATLLEHAYRRCGRAAADISPEMAKASRELLYLLMSKYSNDGLNLWALEKVLMGLYPGQAVYDLPAGTQRITQLVRRQPQRFTDSLTWTSSAGGTAANLYDEDVDTVCTQTSPNGNIQVDAGSGETLQVTSFGVMSNGAANYTLVAETSADAVTWTEQESYPIQAYADKKWVWFDILTPGAGFRYFRVRETGGATLDLRELYLGQLESEIPITQINRDDYFLISNRTSEGIPNLYWFDRQRDSARVWLWNVPNSYFTNLMVLWRQRQLQDVGSDINILDVPQRALPAVLAGYAAELAQEMIPPVPEPVIARLKAKADEEWGLWALQESDGARTTLIPAIGVYTA